MQRHEQIRAWLDGIERLALQRSGPIRLMEVCGTHTTAIFRSGLPSLMPSNLQLLSGPGCPVCVTAQSEIDAMIELARQDLVLCSYGDMLRVPGIRGSLEQARGQGADVRTVYGALDVLRLAQSEPTRQFVFAAVGFETTAPATAALILQAQREGVCNLFVLTAHKRVLPALQALLSQDALPLDGIVLPGHVSIVLGANAYQELPDRFRLPMVIAGFEDWQLLQAIHHLLEQRIAGEHRLENLYPQAVLPAGNRSAQAMLERVFESVSAPWRGLGEIAGSGFGLRAEFADFDAARQFHIVPKASRAHSACRCGDIITGRAQPFDCALFARTCTPLHPLGPCMVSSEGTCQAWFKYRRTAAMELTR